MFTSSERTTDGDSIILGASGSGYHNEYHDPLEDVFGSEPTSPADDRESHVHQERLPQAELSDIPRLRSVHVTNGYREGISAGKERSLQVGFDEGYALGAEYGHITGWIRGVLEGLLIIAARQKSSGRAQIQQLLDDSEKELSLLSLFNQSYFGEDGTWTYDVSGSDDTTTFRRVAAAHPLLVKWRKLALDAAAGLSIVVGEVKR